MVRFKTLKQRNQLTKSDYTGNGFVVKTLTYYPIKTLIGKRRDSYIILFKISLCKTALLQQ